MNSGNLESGQQLAVLGLMLGYEQPFGEPPTLIEIDEFARGDLSDSRAREVLSYIANETTYFEQWRNLLDADQWLESEALQGSEPGVENADELPKKDQMAALGLLLGRTEPFGEPPDLIEIDQWSADQIDTARGAEIASYLANDSRYFQQWLELQEAEQWLEKNTEDESIEQPEPLQPGALPAAASHDEVEAVVPKVRSVGLVRRVVGKLSTAANVPYIGAAVAALLVFFVLPFQFFSGGSTRYDLNDQFASYSAIGAPAPVMPWQPGATKSLQVPPVELSAFRAGASDAIARLKSVNPDFDWSQWVDVLPTDEQDPCADSDDSRCGPSLADMKVLGEWSVLTHAACAASESDSRSSLLNDLDKKWQLITENLRETDASALDILAIDSSLPICERSQASLLRAVSRGL